VNNIPAVSGGVWPTGNSDSLPNGQSVFTSRTPITYTAATSYMANSIN